MLSTLALLRTEDAGESESGGQRLQQLETFNQYNNREILKSEKDEAELELEPESPQQDILAKPEESSESNGKDETQGETNSRKMTETIRRPTKEELIESEDDSSEEEIDFKSNLKG